MYELWTLKSQINWTVQGDRNTLFFYLFTFVRRKRNGITAIKNRVGEWLVEENIANYIQRRFEDIYSTSQTFSSRLISPSSQWQEVLPNDVRDSLGYEVSVEELKAALWSMKVFKALSPDGLHARFFQRFWLIVGDSVVKEIQKIFKEKIVPEVLNRTHIALIPKVQGPKLLNNYRLISLCNSVYKIITKVIVARLRPHLDQVVNLLQTTFVPNRRGTNNAIIVQELIHTISKAKGKKWYMAIKIDLEKAYDKLEWSFIRATLMRINLPQDLIAMYQIGRAHV